MSKYIFNNDTDILEFLEQLRENGIQIWGEGEKIRYRSKNRQLAPETLRILKMAKGQILDFFRMIEKNVIPLTSIQTAYVVGQTAGCELGNINAHYYIEYTIIAFSEMASLCITKASELLGENIIINRIFLINPSKAKESDLYLGDISIIDGNSVAIKSWEKAVLGNVREFESNSNDIFDIIMRELENDK